jgi:hypothetical protein
MDSLYLTKKMQLTVGICAAKALEQLLCERLNDPDNLHVLFLALDTIQTQILHSRAFDAYVPAVNSIQMPSFGQ